METAFISAWLDSLEPTEVYKQDRRSRVWRIDTPDGRSFVIKRFEYNPLRQTLAGVLGVHPGQREQRCCAMLKRVCVSVVPIIASGACRRGLGQNLWLVTPYVGVSLYNLLYRDGLTDIARRGRVMDAVGGLTGQLAGKGLFNRDHKASNILIDGEDRPWLIDVGGVRRSRGAADTLRMLENLRANLAEAGATEAECDRVERACRQSPESSTADSSR